MSVPINITGFGIQSDVLGDNFCIYFLSVHNAKKVYLADGCVTENLNDAIWSDDINFVTTELTNLLSDEDFMEYLESEVVL